MDKFDNIINEAKEYYIIQEATPWDKLKQLGRQASYMLTGKPTTTTGWDNPVDSKNIYTLNVEPKTNSEEVIKQFMQAARINTTPEDETTEEISTEELPAEESMCFDDYINMVLEFGQPILRAGQKDAYGRRIIQRPETQQPVQQTQQSTNVQQDQGNSNNIKTPEPSTNKSIDLFFDPETLLPHDDEKSINTWKKIVGKEIIDARRNNNGVNVTDISNRLQGKHFLPSDPKQAAVEIWIRDKLNKEPGDYTNFDPPEFKTALNKFNALGSSESPEDKADYKKYMAQAQKETSRSRDLLSADVINGLHNQIQKDFANAGLYYLTPQQFETMKAGRWAATKAIGGAIKNELQGLHRAAKKYSGSPTVQF